MRYSENTTFIFILNLPDLAEIQPLLILWRLTSSETAISIHYTGNPSLQHCVITFSCFVLSWFAIYKSLESRNSSSLISHSDQFLLMGVFIAFYAAMSAVTK